MEIWQNAMILAMQNRTSVQTIAHEKLGDKVKAKLCPERGLRVPALQTSKGLIEQLKRVGNQA